MNIDLDISKMIIGACTFIITFAVNRNIRRMDALDEKLERLSLDMAELKGSISGRFVINEVTPIKELKRKESV